MRQAATVEAFVRAPVGKWVLAGQTVVWCHSPSLGGGTCWGRPDLEATRAALLAYEGYRRLSGPVDVILDASALEGVLPDALFALLEWVRDEADGLHRRVRRQIGVVPSGVDGATLAGVAPLTGFPFPFEVMADARAAFRSVLPDGGDALAEELARLVATARSMPPLMSGLRTLIRTRDGRITLASAAQALGVSQRSLQRLLRDAGSSFRQELFEGRFDLATRLLAVTDDKIASVAARIGVTEAALVTLVRERTGQRPTEYRESLRKK